MERALDGHPELSEALRAVDDGKAGSVVVAKLDRLSRSVHDAAGLLDRAKRHGWSLVAADIGVDTATATGEAMANMMATFAQLERRLIGDRTRGALAAKRAEGVRLGRPSALLLAVVGRVIHMRVDGAPLAHIARVLTADDVPTAQGGRHWYPSTVRAVLAGQDANRPARSTRRASA